MIDLISAARIASEWYSPREPALVALATARKVPDAEALIDEIDDNIRAAGKRPDLYDPCAVAELHALRDWAADQA